MQNFKFSSKLVKSLFLAMLCVSASAQFVLAGGMDTYQIYLNKKLVLTQQGSTLSAGIMSLQLDKSNYNDQLVIIYNHCGATGKGRNIVVKNDENKILKEWKFADATGSDVSMTIPVKDILELKKNNAGTSLNLFYSSSDLLPKGRTLASFNLGDKSVSQSLPATTQSTVSIAALSGKQ